MKTETDNANSLALSGLNALSSAKGIKAPNTKRPSLTTGPFCFMETGGLLLERGIPMRQIGWEPIWTALVGCEAANPIQKNPV